MTGALEQGAHTVPGARWRRLLNRAKSLTTPLQPSDYLALLDPRWLERELTATVHRTIHETPTARTLVLRPHGEWKGHQPGQYVRLGVEIDGIRLWRAYSITSDPGHPLGEVSVTVQRVDGGVVSTHLVDVCKPGDELVLGSVDGTFVLPRPAPPRILMVTAGCGVTPVMSMLRELERRGELRDVVHVHVSRDAESALFGPMLRSLDAATNGYRLVERHTGGRGRLLASELDAIQPDWADRDTFLSGPADMMTAFRAHWSEHGDPQRLHTEDFQPVVGLGHTGAGGGGTVEFRVSDLTAEAAPGMSILVAGERAGARLPYGCRMGICHSCIGRLAAGQVCDLRTGEVHGEVGQAVRTCVNGPVGDTAIEL